MQNLEGDAQMNGPEEATQESAWLLATIWPQKRGYSCVSAAIKMNLSTRFRGRVVLGLYVLYHL